MYEAGRREDCSPPPKKNLGNLDILGRKRKFGINRFYKKFASACVLLLIEEGYFLF